MTTTRRYSLASTTWGMAEIEAVTELARAQTTSMGGAVFSFEKEFATFVGAKHAVMVNSGSSANLLMTAALFFTQPEPRLKTGDEIVVPAISWPTTYYPLQQYGLRLKFVDVDLHTLNYDLEALETAVSHKTRAIMAVNLLGNPNNFDVISDIIGNRDIILLEDNCESLGATFGGRYAGSIGLMGTYSFFFSHHISTMEGGMIVTNDDHLHDLLLCLRAHGWTRNLQKENTLCVKSENPFEESFRFLLPGYNVRPLEMEGAIGREQLKKLPGFLAARRKNAKHFLSLFSDNPHFMVQQGIGAPSWFGFSLVLRPGSPLKRNQVAATLLGNKVECRQIVSGNFAAKDVMRYFDYSISGTLANAEYVDANGLFIGNDHVDHAEDLNRVHSILLSLA
ncbi:aminotransferase class I/II-fold pyridoxal phosphate-dependent enzyme [Desulfovibrio sp.]|uniref:DegT/DnrJ/EryC1/StrS family aminotransferase n=1 Tax=Desulfovibrio sp. TaxID=885 RepID=UPI0025C531B6|nr:aminotransferase class I/II-fold pyridoxal phosphate-dependent enzyme [Desulfovibrio sp.]